MPCGRPSPGTAAAARPRRARSPRRRAPAPSAGSARTTSTTSGSRWVMSSRLRVAISTSSPRRCTWIRMPSSFASTASGAVDLGQRRVEVGRRRREHRLDRATDGQADRGQRLAPGEGRVDDVRRAPGEHRRSSYVGDRHARGLRDALGHHRLQRALSDVAAAPRPAATPARPRSRGRTARRPRPPARRRIRARPGSRGARTRRRPRRRRATVRRPAAAASAGRASRGRCGAAGAGR